MTGHRLSQAPPQQSVIAPGWVSVCNWERSWPLKQLSFSRTWFNFLNTLSQSLTRLHMLASIGLVWLEKKIMQWIVALYYGMHTHTHIERAKRQGHCRGSVRIDWYSRIAFYIAVRRLGGPLISFLTNDLSVKWQSFLNILSRIRRIMFTCLSSHAYPIRKTYQIEPLAYFKFRQVSLWSHFLPTHRCMLSRFPLPSNLTLNVIPRWRLWNLSLSKRHDLGSGSPNKKHMVHHMLTVTRKLMDDLDKKSRKRRSSVAPSYDMQGHKKDLWNP